jgi:hypothetical protein
MRVTEPADLFISTGALVRKKHHMINWRAAPPKFIIYNILIQVCLRLKLMALSVSTLFLIEETNYGLK